MAEKSTGAIKAILIIFGFIFLIYWGLMLVFANPSMATLYGTAYPQEPVYVRTIGMLCVIFGLLLLFASRDPIKNILVINIMIIHSILFVIFYLVGLLLIKEMVGFVWWLNLIITFVFLILLLLFRPKKA
jgi:hypothetical protein